MYIYVTSVPEVFGLYKETHVKSRTCRSLTKINNLAVINSWKGCSIALIHDTRYLCTPFIKTMSRGISGTNKWYNLPIRAIAFEFVYFLKTRERLNGRAKCTVSVSTSCTSLLLSGGHSSIRSKWWFQFSTIIMICYHHLSDKKVLICLMSTIYKLDFGFVHWQILLLVCPLRNHVTLLLSCQSLSTCRDGGYRE